MSIARRAITHPVAVSVIAVGVIVFGLLFAMDLMQVDFAEDIVKIVIAAGTVALAIAFGVGGIDAGKRWWAKYGTPSDGGGGASGGAPTPTSHD